MRRSAIAAKTSLSFFLLLALSTLPYLPWLNSYFYYDDGTLLNLGQLAAAGNWHLLIGFGFIGHFRPLPILTTAAIYHFAGGRSPFPYHLAALAIHVINVQLMYRLLVTLLPRTLRLAALFGAAIFSVHWAGSEAATYFAAIGILWSMLGGLIAALSAVRCFASRGVWPWIGFNAGLLISFGGGEYAVAVLPLIAAAALLVFLRHWRSRGARLLLGLGANLVLWLALYVIFEVLHQPAGRLGTEYVLSWRMFLNLNVDVARTSFPTPWINAAVSFYLVAGVWLFLIVRKIKRPRSLPLFDRMSIFFAVGVFSSLPFAPSMMGNYPRFAYLGAAFWAVGLLLVCVSFARDRRGAAAILLAAGCALVAVNLAQLQVRMMHLSPLLDAVRQTVLETEQRVHDSPAAQVRFVNPDLQGVGFLLIARKDVNPLHIYWTAPPKDLPPTEPQILIRSSWTRPYFVTRMEPHAAGKTGPPG